jgi:hypothetical protein
METRTTGVAAAIDFDGEVRYPLQGRDGLLAQAHHAHSTATCSAGGLNRFQRHLVGSSGTSLFSCHYNLLPNARLQAIESQNDIALSSQTRSRSIDVLQKSDRGGEKEDRTSCESLAPRASNPEMSSCPFCYSASGFLLIVQ